MIHTARMGLSVSFALLICFFLQACAPKSTKDSIVISGPFEPVNQDPATVGYIFTRLQVIETLVDVRENGELIPGLATTWSSDNNFKTWTFTLRPNVYFHDGQPMDADAVYKSLAVALGKPTPFEKAIFADMKILSDSQIRFTLNQSYRPFPSLLSNYTMAIIAPSSFGTFNRIKGLVGTGPYKITHFEPPHNIVTERYENYWGAPAKINKVEYITGHRSETRALMVRTGQADIVYNLDPAAVKMLQADPNVRVFSKRIPRTTLIKLNSEDPVLSDRRVRQALSLSIDRQGIANGVLRTPGLMANQIFGPNMGDWHVDSLPKAQQNIAQARNLLDKAGWITHEDGVRYRNGTPLRLSMITYANRPELINIATAIQDQWADIGVKLSIHMENVSAIPSGHADGTLQTALLARNFANIPNPLGIMLADFSSSAGGAWGPMNWTNTTVFSQLKRLSETTDDNEYAALINSIMTEIQDDTPLIPVVYYVQKSAVSSRIKHFSFDPYERSFRISSMQIE